MNRIRVLIADDSATMCNVLSSLLAKDPGIEVVGCARDGEQAVAMAVTLLPHVITMDVQMPRMGGLEAIERIMEKAPSRILAVCSVEDRDVDLSFRAISAGALELIAKPEAGPRYAHAQGQKRVRGDSADGRGTGRAQAQCIDASKSVGGPSGNRGSHCHRRFDRGPAGARRHLGGPAGEHARSDSDRSTHGSRVRARVRALARTGDAHEGRHVALR